MFTFLGLRSVALFLSIPEWETPLSTSESSHYRAGQLLSTKVGGMGNWTEIFSFLFQLALLLELVFSAKHGERSRPSSHPSLSIYLRCSFFEGHEDSLLNSFFSHRRSGSPVGLESEQDWMESSPPAPPPSLSLYGQKEMVMVGRSFVAERPKEERAAERKRVNESKI